MIDRPPRHTRLHAPARATAIDAGRRRRSARRGVVLIITLFAVLLLAGLLAYVLNHGRQTHIRLVTQHAADSSAAAGATWMARSLNSVAMNNVAMSRLIALASVLDATDEAVHPAWHEADAWYDALTRQRDALSRTAAPDWAFGEVDRVRRQLLEDRDLLAPVKNLLIPAYEPEVPDQWIGASGGIDIRNTTFYDPPSGSGDHGTLWQAMQTLDDYNQVIMSNLGPLAVTCGIDGGEVNLPGYSGPTAALLLPVAPRVPYLRGTFEDFKQPVQLGLLPPGVDDKTVNRGPYDTLFGWRDYVWQTSVVSPGNRVLVSGPSSGSGPSSIGGFGPRNEGPRYEWDPPPRTRRDPVAYRTFGPHEYLLGRQNHFDWPDTRQSRFYGWRGDLANLKLAYLFENRAIEQRRLPVWLTDFDEAARVADTGSDQAGQRRTIHETAWYVIRVEVPDLLPSVWPEPNTPYTIKEQRITRLAGDWRVDPAPCAYSTNDPRRWQQELNAYITQCPAFAALDPESKDLWTTAQYQQIDPSPAWRFRSKIVRDDRVIWQYTYYLFLGIDVGQNITIRNPHNFSDRSALPAPTDLDHAAVSMSRDDRRRWLTMLAVARSGDRAVMWPGRFSGDKPASAQVAIAQVQVFNNHSWDLWTQMWHAQLQPVADYPRWMADMEAGASQIAGASDIRAEDYQYLRAYLANIAPMASLALEH